MSYMIRASLGNLDYPEHGIETLDFPIPKEKYAETIAQLNEMGIGDPRERDCFVHCYDRGPGVLRALESRMVNVEEMDFLAKLLARFDEREMAQFQSMAHKLGLTDMTDFVNLSICCQRVTVVTDFSDLEAIGKTHYINLAGGACAVEELRRVNGESVAWELLSSGAGTITPYGVVYDNGMELEQIYDGVHFPDYVYDRTLLEAQVSESRAPDAKTVSFMLPMPKEQIARWLERCGMDAGIVALGIYDLPDRVMSVAEQHSDELYALNDMCKAIPRQQSSGRQVRPAVRADRTTHITNRAEKSTAKALCFSLLCFTKTAPRRGKEKPNEHTQEHRLQRAVRNAGQSSSITNRPNGAVLRDRESRERTIRKGSGGRSSRVSKPRIPRKERVFSSQPPPYARFLQTLRGSSETARSRDADRLDLQCRDNGVRSQPRRVRPVHRSGREEQLV